MESLLSSLGGAHGLLLLLRYALALPALLAAALALLVASAPLWLPLLHPTPSRGARQTLPNGLVVQRWTKMEADILYKEIWGADASGGGGGGAAHARGAYAQGGLVRFWRGMVVVDVGANVGFFTLYAAQRCGGDARIMSVEPIPTTFAVLRDNAAAANTGQMDGVLRGGSGGGGGGGGAHARALAGAGAAGLKIVPVHCAVGDVARGAVVAATFAHHPNLSIWSTSSSALAGARVDRIVSDFTTSFRKLALAWLLPPVLFEWALRAVLVRHFARTEEVRVEVRRTGDVLAGPLREPGARIGLLKVDVEGAELEVLRGIDAEQWPRIDQVVMELESFADVREAERLLRARGFSHTTWEASERAQGAEKSEVCLLYASRETDDEVQRRLAAAAADVEEVADEDDEVVELVEPAPPRRRGSTAASPAFAAQRRSPSPAPAVQRRSPSPAPAAAAAQVRRRAPSPAPAAATPSKIELAMREAHAVQEQRKLAALQAIRAGAGRR